VGASVQHGYRRRMRWDNLFDDLEGQLEQELSAEDLDLRVEEERLRLSRLTLRDRLLAIHAAPEYAQADGIPITLRGGAVLTVAPVTFGRDWMSARVVGEGNRDRQCIVPFAALASLTLTRGLAELSLGAVPDESSRTSIPGRLGFAFVLRDLCRRRVALDVQTTDTTVHGTIDRVGRDHLDVAVHERSEFRREAAVLQIRVIPLDAVVLVAPT
jgi:hypothetical protein